MVRIWQRRIFTILQNFSDEKTNNDFSVKKRTAHFGSFYLRVGAISFGIGTMVYSGLEFGQYFEINRKESGISDWITFDLHHNLLLQAIQIARHS